MQKRPSASRTDQNSLSARPTASIEELEPRILFSADPLTLGVEGTQALTVAEIRLLEEDGSAQEPSAQVVQSQAPSREIAFIDADIENLEDLIGTFDEPWQSGRDIEVVFITEAQDAFQHIGATLAARSGIGAVHLFTRADVDGPSLGASVLDARTLAANATSIRAWQHAFNANSEILLYSEQALTGPQSANLSQAFMRLTGAQVGVQQDEPLGVPAVSSTSDTPPTVRDVVLIDRGLDDSAALAAAVDANAVTYVYDGDAQTAGDVLRWVTQWAIEQNSQIASLSILSHGAAGGFELGNQWITSTNFTDTAAQWQALSAWFTSDASVDIFGCNVASQAGDGRTLLERLSAATGTDVFASDDVTGIGGDWILEVSSAPFAAIKANAALDVQALTNAQVSLAWYNTSWGYRKAVTIDEAMVSGTSDLSNFAVLVSVTDASLRSVANGGNVGQNDGGDLLFTSADGTTKLAHEIESYDAATGTLVAWVKVPTLSHASDTSLFLYYGNAGAADQWNIAGTWQATDEGVWHLGSDYSDSTGNASGYSVTNVADASTAKIGAGEEFNGSSSTMTATDNNALDITSELTVSTWFNSHDLTGFRPFVQKGASNTSYNYYFATNANELIFEYYNAGYHSFTSSTANLSTSTWYYAAATYDDASNTVRIFLNGTQVYSTNTATSSLLTNAAALRIGNSTAFTEYFDGVLDEVRVRSSVMTSAWLTTEYNNQNAPGTYVTLAAQQTVNQVPVNTVPGAQSTNEDVTKVLSSGIGNQISIADTDAGGANNEVTLSVTNGTLDLSGIAGLVFSVGDGTGDATMTFRGTAADINTALNGLSYIPTAEYSGSATLTLRTLDSALVTLNFDANLEGRYLFDGNTTDTAPGTAQNGTLVGNATYVADGTRGQVLSLDGSGDYVQISGTYSNPNEVTIGGWVNLSAVSARGEFITLSDRVHIALDETGNGVKGSIQTSASTWADLTSGQFIAGTGWRHVAYTYSDSTNLHTLYIDGVVVASAAIASSIYWTGAGDTFIGSHPSIMHHPTARIDDIRIYNRVLSTSEIVSLSSDLSLQDADTVAVTVNAVNDPPVITSDSGGATASVSVAENTTAVTTVTSTDVDGGTAAYSIVSGADAALFSINSSTGALTFSTARDYETPADVGGNNVYDVVVRVSDGNGGTDDQAIAVTVTDVAGTLVVTTAADNNDSGITAGASFTAEWLNANKGADNAISLREAIFAANNTAGTNSIAFNISGAGVHTIAIGSTALGALPDITDAVLIDGYTQGSASANTAATGSNAVLLIELEGSSAGVGADGLRLASGSDGSTIRGLVIHGFDDDGIAITSDGNTVSGSFIGTNSSGSGAIGVGDDGIDISSGADNNVIGGTTLAARNIIAGNAGNGIRVGGASTLVRNNLVGLGANGSVDLGNAGAGILITGGSNVIGGDASYGNVISGNATYGVGILGGTNNVVAGNIIGLDATGSLDRGNDADGVSIRFGANNNLIGGTTSAARNILSGNARGVLIIDGVTGNTVAGNYIGTDISGELDLGNDSSGVEINGSTSNTVGGSTSASRNVISGNVNGIYLNTAADSNTIQSNYLGTDDDGVQDLGNSQSGIYLADSDSNTIGGTGAGNVISGNDGYGMYVANSDTNLIRSNYIGVNNTGNVALGNTFNGIYLGGGTGNVVGGAGAGLGNVIGGHGDIAVRVEGGTAHVVQGNSIGVGVNGVSAVGNLVGVSARFGATDLLIGGASAPQGNLIANNGHGVLVEDATTARIAILGNQIRANTQLGINLVTAGDPLSGVTANDIDTLAPIVHDTDTGPNGLQNFPVLVSASLSGANLTLSGTLQTEANKTYRIEFFHNAAGTQDASGNGEGAVLLGSLNVTTDANGEAAISITFNSTSVLSNDYITATATEDLGGGNYGGTSEFAQNALVTVFSGAPVNTVPGAQTVNEDTLLSLSTLSVTDAQNNLTSVQLSVTQGVLNVTLSGAASISAGANGSATLTISGSQADINATLVSLTYQGNLNYSGADTLSMVSTDAGAASDSDTVGITVTSVNDEQVLATNTGVTVAENSTGTVITSAMLASTDVDHSAAQLTYTLSAVPANGTLRRNGVALGVSGTFTQADVDAGLLTYDHNGSETTSDSFAFSVNDGVGATSSGTFSIAITAVNDNAPVVTSSSAASVVEGATVVATVTSADADVPAGTHSYSIVGGADQALFSIHASTGALTFNAAPNFEAPADAGANNVYNLTVQVSDGVNTTTQAITVTVTNVNEAPSGSTGTITVNEDTPYAFGAADFGFTDPDAGDVLSAVRIDSLPGAGALTLAGVPVNAGDVILLASLSAGDLVFTPAADANGVAYATLSFSVRDTNGPAFDGTANTLTVNVTAVNDPPVANAESYSLVQDSVLNVAAPGVSANDTDVEADPLTAALVSGASNGSVVLNADGSFSYTPSVGYVGADSFTYRVNDGTLNSGIVTVSLTVTTQPSTGGGGPIVIGDPLPDPGPDSSPEPQPDPEPAPSADDPASSLEQPDASSETAAAVALDAYWAQASQNNPTLEQAILDSGQIRQMVMAESTARNSALRVLLVAGGTDSRGDAGFEFHWEQVIRQGLSISEVGSGTAHSELQLHEAPAKQDEALWAPSLASPGLWGGLIAGFGTAWWAGRAGILLTSVLAGTPAWARLDPLPIAMRVDDRDETDDDAEDTQDAYAELFKRRKNALGTDLREADAAE